ncbi:MAG: indolepyruvate ferredoxin oxidoreductase family protein [Proteobacteria bacterium]|nr:indolepyruvate ferredoxin oxidoreductase family protein [Pseudomonadota bacterium]
MPSKSCASNPEPMKQVTLEDKYTARTGRVYLSGAQALVRLPLMQRQRDVMAGLNTAGYISGYTGSPLGTYDFALAQARVHLDEHHVRFQPGLNEDLAATAVWGSQQVAQFGKSPYDGVFALWYGKGPGVDRSGDAIKHGNYAGSAKHGGVLLLAGDDHGAKSSTIAHQSDTFFIHAGMPYLNPANVQEYLDYGLYGIALSRFSGCWVGFKCITDTVEASASVDIDPDRVRIVEPDDFTLPPQGLNLRAGVLPIESERRLYQERLEAVKAFVRANHLDRVMLDAPVRRIALVATGKAYLDLRQALEELGLDDAALAGLGVVIYKVAVPWPLEPRGILDLAGSVEEILVVEEKRGIIEDQIARLLINLPVAPRLVGKHDETGAVLISEVGELSAAALTPVLARRLLPLAATLGRTLEIRPGCAPAQPAGAGQAPSLTRMPAFCAGCPHNTSTNIPAGSVAMGGIGCHGLALWLPERRTLALSHMGGEGAMWMGIAPFTETRHIFQNMGDGTYTHSGLLAIRAVVASGANITYKILVNDAIAMTGGQPIAGKAAVAYIVRQLESIGVGQVAVVTDAPDKYADRGDFPPATEIFHRDRLDEVQRRLREIPGCTALVYDQVCATEKRRRRKRGKWATAPRHIVINPAVCEGCGDCGVQSNCIALEPLETPQGRKRQVNQSVCNDDYSCIKGYCPSFVSLYGAKPRRIESTTTDGSAVDAVIARLVDPPPASLDQPCNILVAGIGGSGVVTLGALMGMAAHLEGKACSVLDITGLAQRNGAVTSHIRLAARPEQIHSSRIGVGSADLILGCDIVVATAADVLTRISPQRTRITVNNHVAPTSAFARNPDMALSAAPMLETLSASVGSDQISELDATQIAMKGFGDTVAGNLFLLGHAFQQGGIPLSRAALEQAIEINGIAVDTNRRAFAWGRAFAHTPALVEQILAKPATRVRTQTLDERIAFHSKELEAYQNAAYARRYQALVDAVRRAEAALGSEVLTTTVARHLFKLMAYKDEYEVARLHTRSGFIESLQRDFEGDFRITFHMAPPILPRNKKTGRIDKREFGPWMLHVLRLLASLRFLRGTPFDPFGRAAHRRFERNLIVTYESVMRKLLPKLGPDTLEAAIAIAAFPEHVRGYDTIKEENARTTLAALQQHIAALGLPGDSLAALSGDHA